MPLRRWPLAYQILIVNSAIVFLGAAGGTAITRQLATQSGTALTALFAALGLILSIVANYLLLRVALRPLLLLQTVAELVAAGDLRVRAAELQKAEPALTRLIQTFNAMLDRIEQNNLAIEQSRELTEQLAQQVLSAQEEERRRIARELHDETLQSLATLVIYADAAASADGPGKAATLARLREVAERTLTGVRSIISDLRPSLLDDLGLAAAVRWQAQNRLEPAGIRVDVQLRGEGRRLSSPVETALYRVIQEAVTNILKHAQATYVEIDLDLSQEDRVSVRIEDDGNGFVRQPAMLARAEGGVGLFGMQERINLIGGELSVDTALGEGTEIRVCVPLVPSSSVSETAEQVLLPGL
jgi:two-component system, NarL family, sensor histidine kinase UhpB